MGVAESKASRDDGGVRTLLMLASVLTTLGCGGRTTSAVAPPTRPPNHEAGVVTARPTGRAATEVRIDATGLWLGEERIAATDSGDVATAALDPADGNRIPSLVERLAAVRAQMPPDEVSGSDERPLEPRFATVRLQVVRLTADPATPSSAIVRIVGSAAAARASIVELRILGGAPEAAVPITLAPGSGASSATVFTVTGSGVFCAPPAGELFREIRRPAEPVDATLARLLAQLPTSTSGPVVLSANPDVPAADLFVLARTLQNRGAPALLLSAGIR